MDDVFRVVKIAISECFKDFDFNFSLFMEFLPILEDLNRYRLFIHMVIAFQNHSESSSTKLLLDLVSVINLVLWLI